MNRVTAVDLFAGLGGFTEGAEQAGVRVLIAANHWAEAVRVHAGNHPDVRHEVQDLRQADFTRLPDFDLLLASPACQGHSKARGRDRPGHDAARSTAWAVVAAAEAKRPPYLIVENVPDFTRWELFPQWRSCLAALGYAVSENVLDAADLGVPQHRRRLFVVGVHRHVRPDPIRVPEGDAAHVAAETILEPDGAAVWSSVGRPGRAGATLARVANGRRVHGGRFLLAYYGSERGGRSLGLPLGTVTTRDRYALVDGERMRMLAAAEYRRAMGFRADYRLPAGHKRAVYMLGNAVCPPVARHVVRSVLAA